MKVMKFKSVIVLPEKVKNVCKIGINSQNSTPLITNTTTMRKFRTMINA